MRETVIELEREAGYSLLGAENKVGKKENKRRKSVDECKFREYDIIIIIINGLILPLYPVLCCFKRDFYSVSSGSRDNCVLLSLLHFFFFILVLMMMIAVTLVHVRKGGRERGQVLLRATYLERV